MPMPSAGYKIVTPDKGSECNQSVHCVTTMYQAFYPFPPLGLVIGNLFEVAAHRDCPFHPNLIDSSLLLLSSGRPARSLAGMLSHAVRTFLRPHSGPAMLCASYAQYRNRFFGKFKFFCLNKMRVFFYHFN